MKSNRLRSIISKNESGLQSLTGNILSASKGVAAKTIYVASSRRGEGRTTTSVGFAWALSRSCGGNVLLVDASFASPGLYKVFGVTPGPGLMEVLSGEIAADEAIRDTDNAKVKLLTCGAASRFSEGGVVEPFATLLEALAAEYEYVVVDGSPVLASSDGSALAKCFDGVAIVAECEKTKWEVLNLAKERILNVGGNILGVVMNKRRFYVPRIFYR